MAKTVSEAFTEFEQNLEPTESDREKIIKRHSFIRESLRGKIVNDKRIPDLLIGSYIRHTQMRPINDIDIMVVFDYGEYWDKYASTPQNFLRYLKIKLREIFPNTDLRTQPHSIGLKFTETPDVDIVPAFLIDDQKEIFLIPDKDFTEYIKTSPRMHQKIISSHNDFLQQKFVRIVKMLKKWKESNVINLKSFHLEVFAMKVLDRPFINYQNGLLYFFNKASNKIFEFCDDPIHLSGQLDSYLDNGEKTKLSKIFTSIYQDIGELIKLEASGEHQKAINGWRRIFGDHFPKMVEATSVTKESNQNQKTTRFPPNGQNPRFGDS